MDIYIFIYVFEIISQFCATPPIYMYVRVREGKNLLDRDRHQQKMVRRSIQK